MLNILRDLKVLDTRGAAEKGFVRVVNICRIADSAVKLGPRKCKHRDDRWWHVQEVWNSIIEEKCLDPVPDTGSEFEPEDPMLMDAPTIMAALFRVTRNPWPVIVPLSQRVGPLSARQ